MSDRVDNLRKHVQGGDGAVHLLSTMFAHYDAIHPMLDCETGILGTQDALEHNGPRAG